MLHRAVALSFFGLVGCTRGKPCPTPSGAHTCLISREIGDVPHGELGFRFAEPADVDGDGNADMAAGGRFKGTGYVQVFDRAKHRWDGDHAAGLYGQDVITVRDLNGDGNADLVISAPNALIDNKPAGIVEARTGAGELLWRATGQTPGLGWQLDNAGDQDGDGLDDIWAGAPSDTQGGHVYLLAGKDGQVIRRIDNQQHDGQFGWYLVAMADLDGDGHTDLAVGAPFVGMGGAVYLIASTGKVLREIRGTRPRAHFGEMLTALDDVNGDGVADLAVGAPGGGGGDPLIDMSEVMIVSGKSGMVLRRLHQRQPGELYGRSLATLDDLDGDGARELAIGAPWAGTAAAPRMGRVEVRSVKNLKVLAQIEGATANEWFGWHMARAGTALSKPGIIVGRLWANEGAGALELHQFR
ncbi:MAG: VCBS repeat-containing protein [Kofleriaceae bacterium]|nr:VCBS repeat-containing protein [Kofleriaceae bacterium]